MPKARREIITWLALLLVNQQMIRENQDVEVVNSRVILVQVLDHEPEPLSYSIHVVVAELQHRVRG